MRMCEQIEVAEVPKISSRDPVLHRLSANLEFRVNERNKVLPSLKVNIAKSWTPCSNSKERSRVTLPASSVAEKGNSWFLP